MNATGRDRPRTLVAGAGNIFLGDDGFGVETVRALAGRPLPDHVEVADIGIRGVHLAYRLLDGYGTLVLVDATARGGEPGTLYLIEPDRDGGTGVPSDTGTVTGTDISTVTGTDTGVLDGHGMSPDAVLALLDRLCAGTGAQPPRRILVVGCEPACVEEGIGLSPRVAAAVPGAVRMITDLVHQSAPARTGLTGGAHP
ncbi:protease [Streptomyces spongiicola]|uniref:Protease n=1 Tax=Streptomyces spongiicola TaxID=1690221 RepID=A0ABM6V5C9_9ACTN|nr:hydrogenase maturation protease [Streptomyces spongiicola]AWK09111.1 protease [Streptomyces spongiicola]